MDVSVTKLEAKSLALFETSPSQWGGTNRAVGNEDLRYLQFNKKTINEILDVPIRTAVSRSGLVVNCKFCMLRWMVVMYLQKWPGDPVNSWEVEFFPEFGESPNLCLRSPHYVESWPLQKIWEKNRVFF